MPKMPSYWFHLLLIIILQGLRQLKELQGKMDQVIRICSRDKKLELNNNKVMLLVIIITQ